MKIVRNILIAVIFIEFVWACSLAAQQMSRVSPPTVDMQKLDPVTIVGLNELRTRVQEGHKGSWRDLAEAYLGNGYYVAAEQCFRQAAIMNPQDLQARYARGFCLERIGRTSSAIEVLKETAQDANSELAATCWYQIGRCYLREENEAEAEKAFRKNPEFQPAEFHLAKLLIRSGRVEEAIPIVEKQLADMPNSLKLIQLRMYAAEAVDDKELVARLRDLEDRAEYQIILEYGQSFITMFTTRQGLSALLSNALKLKTDGTLEERKEALKKPLSVIRSNKLWSYRSVLLAAAYVELGLGNIDLTKELLTDIEQYTQGGVDVLDLQAQIAETEGDHETAYKLRLRAAAMKPTPEIYFTLANTQTDVTEAVRQQHKAMSDLRAAIEAWQHNQVSTAEKSLRRCEEILEKNELFLFYDGETKRVLGDQDEALRAYEKLLIKNPDHGRALVRLQQLTQSPDSSNRDVGQP